MLVHVEATLNSRLLTPISSGPTDITVLTPSHFLIDDLPLSVLSKRDISTTLLNRLTRGRNVIQL